MGRDIYVPREGPHEEHFVEVEDAETAPEEEPVAPTMEEEAVVEEPDEPVLATEPVGEAEIEEDTVWYRRRRTVIGAVVLVILLLLLCCLLSTCCNTIWTKLNPSQSTGSLISTATTEPGCPDGGTMVSIQVPTQLSATEAVLVGQESNDIAGHSFEVFMYDDPDEPEWNIIVESIDTASSLCWLDASGWHRAQLVDDIEEPGTNFHNIEFLVPPGSISGVATISVNIGP